MKATKSEIRPLNRWSLREDSTQVIRSSHVCDIDEKRKVKGDNNHSFNA